MTRKDSSQTSSGERLTKATAEQVFGWKSVRKQNGELIGKRQDKAGRWRKAKVPDYANDQRHAFGIDEQLGRSERYMKELFRITRARKLPPEWATPEQRCRAAVKVTGGHMRLVHSTEPAKQ